MSNRSYNTILSSALAEANGSSDYFTASCYQASGGNVDKNADVNQNYFGGYKIIGA